MIERGREDLHEGQTPRMRGMSIIMSRYFNRFWRMSEGRLAQFCDCSSLVELLVVEVGVVVVVVEAEAVAVVVEVRFFEGLTVQVSMAGEMKWYFLGNKMERRWKLYCVSVNCKGSGINRRNSLN